MKGPSKNLLKTISELIQEGAETLEELSKETGYPKSLLKEYGIDKILSDRTQLSEKQGDAQKKEQQKLTNTFNNKPYSTQNDSQKPQLVDRTSNDPTQTDNIIYQTTSEPPKITKVPGPQITERERAKTLPGHPIYIQIQKDPIVRAAFPLPETDLFGYSHKEFLQRKNEAIKEQNQEEAEMEAQMNHTEVEKATTNVTTSTFLRQRLIKYICDYPARLAMVICVSNDHDEIGEKLFAIVHSLGNLLESKQMERLVGVLIRSHGSEFAWSLFRSFYEQLRANDNVKDYEGINMRLQAAIIEQTIIDNPSSVDTNIGKIVYGKYGFKPALKQMDDARKRIRMQENTGRAYLER